MNELYGVLINNNSKNIKSFSLYDLATFSNLIFIERNKSIDLYCDYTNRGRTNLLIPTVDEMSRGGVFSLTFRKIGENTYRITPRVDSYLAEVSI